MSNGATNPSIATALANVFAGSYDIYCVPFNDSGNLTTISAQINSISGALEQRPAVCIYGYTGALGSAVSLNTAVNNYRMLCAYYPYTSNTQCKSIQWEIAACFAAILANNEQPNLPLNDLPMTGIAPSVVADALIGTQIESLLHNGTAPVKNINGQPQHTSGRLPPI